MLETAAPGPERFLQRRESAGMTARRRRAEDWIRRLGKTPLPILATSREACGALAAAPNAGLADVNRVAYRDPALAVNLLCAANGLRHRHLDTRTVSVDQAVLMLGMERCLKLVADCAEAGQELAGQALDGYLRASSHACHTSLLARDWAEVRQDILPAEVATAGLVRSVGDLAMWQHAPERMAEALELAGDLPLASQQAQYVVLGFSVAEISAGMVRHWRLPLLVLEHLIPDKITGRRTLGLALANRLSRLLALGWDHPQTAAVIETISVYLGMDREGARERVQRVSAEALQTLPEGMPAPWAPAAIRGIRETATGRGAPSRGFCILPRPALAATLIKRCAAGHDRRTLQDIQLKHGHVEARDVPVSLALRALHHGIGLSRAIHFGLARDGDYCRPYMALGCEGDPHLPDLHLSTLPRTRLAYYLHSGAPHWLRDEALAELRDELPTRGQRLLDTDSCFLAPVGAPGKPLGLILAHRQGPECQLDAGAFAGFRTVMTALESGLAHVAEQAHSPPANPGQGG